VREARRAAETPWLTYVLVGVNVLMFVLCGQRAGSYVLVQVPAPVLVSLGANVAPFTQFAGQWENLTTNTFLHGGAVHLLFNMVALFQVGPFVERTVGRARFAILYVVAGAAASATSMLAANYGRLDVGVAVGASGAICGLIGGSAVLGWRIEGRGSRLARSMIGWLVFTVGFGYAMSYGGKILIDNYAHVGGAVVGGVCVLLFRRSVQYTLIGRALRMALCAGVCASAFAVQFSRGPAAGRAKLDYVFGRCDDMKLALREMHVGVGSEAEVVRRCEAMH
jgi:rhomboid protease GluP